MILTTLIIILLVLLTVAVAILFAMIGELSTRVTGSEARPQSGPVQQLAEARIGSSASGLPTSFERREGVILIFSTACHACQQLAPQAARFFRDYPVQLVGVLISCATAEAGGQFVERYGITGVVTHLDINGELSTGVLGVSLSPAAVAVDAANIVRSAVAFASYSALANWMDSIFGPGSVLEADAMAK